MFVFFVLLLNTQVNNFSVGMEPLVPGYKPALWAVKVSCSRIQPGPEVIKLFSCSAQLRLKFILLINVKMPTIVGILTFISRINYQILSYEPEFSTNLTISAFMSS